MQQDLVPIYAEFGAAVHDTQVLEYGLVLLMALATRYDEAVFSRDAVGALSTPRAHRTIGELFFAVREKEYFTSAERKAVHKAIRRRNKLIHRYMIDNVEGFLDAEGRERMLLDLRALREDVRKASQIIESLIDRYLEEYGTSMEELAESAETMVAEAGGLEEIGE